MSMGIIITMGSISVGGVIVQKILSQMGKIDEANMIGIVVISMLSSTVIGCIIKVFEEVATLGQ
ncbi:hypothetical protein [Clostridium rectalis]|uniref:hypothetical protein n=1 Tax=Clostridium rectalis TaxID=2040295 RepID=UPI000F643915|nr:hypothetical protein [Clostridium rectalis]